MVETIKQKSIYFRVVNDFYLYDLIRLTLSQMQLILQVNNDFIMLMFLPNYFLYNYYHYNTPH